MEEFYDKLDGILSSSPPSVTQIRKLLLEAYDTGVVEGSMDSAVRKAASERVYGREGITYDD